MSQPLTHQRCQEMLRAAVAHAEDLGVKISVAILDSGAHLRAFLRMDATMLLTIDLAQRKAHTACVLNLPSDTLAEAAAAGHALAGIENTNGGLIFLAGGLPIHDEHGELIGAIGVSGASAEQDKDIAAAVIG